jgi:hypothetical protein
VLLLGIAGTSQAALIVDRGLPIQNLNNGAGADRSNVSWGELQKNQFDGDDFTLPAGPSAWRLDTLSVWFVGFGADNDAVLSNDAFLGSWYEDVSLYVGAVGSPLDRVALADFIPGQDSTNNPNVLATRVQYSDVAEKDYQSSRYWTIVRLDFTNLDLTYAAGTTVQFGLHATGIPGDGDDQFDIAFLHAYNGALSGLPPGSGDDRFRRFEQSVDGSTATFVSTLDSNAPGFWDKSSDINVQVNATPVPEPATMSLLGLGLAGIAGLRRRSSR